MITANVVSADLKLSRSVIKFGFDDFDNKMYAEESLTLTNNGNAKVIFDITMP